MLVNMENEWRVPDRKDYSRMMNQFKWSNHKEGKMHCLKGLLQDLEQSTGSRADAYALLDPEVISSLFREAQENKQPDEVVQLGETMRLAGVKLDRFQQVGVILAHLQLNEPVPAFARLIDLYDSGTTPSERAYEIIAEELAKHASSVDEAYFLLESRKTEGGQVPLPAVNIIIEACAMMGDLDRAFATWAEIEKLGHEPDTGTFNALLHTCIRTREVASGRRLLSRMAQESVDPDSITYMHQCSLHLMAREDGLAHKILDQCREGGFRPQGKMYASLINNAIRSGKAANAKELLEHMKADGHRVSAGLEQRVKSL
jgi:pentatricopeptide repeat protein